METVQLAQGGHPLLNSVFEYNLLENIIGDGSEMISSKSSGNIFRYNTIRNMFGQPGPQLNLRGGNGCIVEGNILIDVAQGLRAYGSNHIISNNYIENTYDGIGIYNGADPTLSKQIYDEGDNISILNNTVVNSKNAGIVIGGEYNKNKTTVLPYNIRVMNNLVITKSGTAYMDEGCEDIYYSGNLALLSENAVLSNLKYPDKKVSETESVYFYRHDTGSAVIVDSDLSGSEMPNSRLFLLTGDKVGADWARGEDFIPPETPSGLTISNITDTSFDISWEPSKDNVEVAGYEVYNQIVFKGGFVPSGGFIPARFIGSTPAETTSFKVTKMSPDSSYYIAVKAIDGNRNYSLPSQFIKVTTQSSPEE